MGGAGPARRAFAHRALTGALAALENCMKKPFQRVSPSTSVMQFVFKISLKRRRRASRTLALRGDQTLDHLHEAIFQAFDRSDPHLYSFYMPKRPQRGTHPGTKVREYTAPEGYEGPDPFGGQVTYDAARVRLDALGLKVGQRFEYLFDFGDSWEHEISVEAIGPAHGTVGYPQLIESRGASPRQYESSGDQGDDGG